VSKTRLRHDGEGSPCGSRSTHHNRADFVTHFFAGMTSKL
jgi:hypothetical protein